MSKSKDEIKKEILEEIARLVSIEDNKKAGSLEPYTTNNSSIFEQGFNILARLLNGSETCTALCIHDNNILISNNNNDFKYTQDYVLHLKTFIQAPFKQPYQKLKDLADQQSIKIKKKLIYKHRAEFLETKYMVNSSEYGISKTFLKEFENKTGDIDTLFSMASNTIKEKTTPHQILKIASELLRPQVDTRIITNFIVENKLDHRIIYAIKQDNIQYLNTNDKEQIDIIHAEMKIVQYLWYNKKLDLHINYYLGITKLACCLCYIAIDVINGKSNGRIKIEGTHGGTYERWLPTEWMLEDESLLQKLKNIQGGEFPKGKETTLVSVEEVEIDQPNLTTLEDVLELDQRLKKLNEESDSNGKQLEDARKNLKKFNKATQSLKNQLAGVENDQKNLKQKLESKTELSSIDQEIIFLQLKQEVIQCIIRVKKPPYADALNKINLSSMKENILSYKVSGEEIRSYLGKEIRGKTVFNLEKDLYNINSTLKIREGNKAKNLAQEKDKLEKDTNSKSIQAIPEENLKIKLLKVVSEEELLKEKITQLEYSDKQLSYKKSILQYNKQKFEMLNAEVTENRGTITESEDTHKISSSSSHDKAYWSAKQIITTLQQKVPNNLEVKGPVVNEASLSVTVREVLVSNLEKFIIPLNVNAVNKALPQGVTGSNSNHWVGLYIVKNSVTTNIKYVDPMGHSINESVKRYIQDQFTVETIEEPLLDKPIQYVIPIDHGHGDDGIEYKGNTHDCGPLLVYILLKLAKGEGLPVSITTKEESIALGAEIRQELNNISENSTYSDVENQNSSFACLSIIANDKPNISGDTSSIFDES